MTASVSGWPPGVCIRTTSSGLLRAQQRGRTPGLFTVERHIRGKWACAKRQTLTQAPVRAQIIDKVIPTAGLLAQVRVAK